MNSGYRIFVDIYIIAYAFNNQVVLTLLFSVVTCQIPGGAQSFIANPIARMHIRRVKEQRREF